MRPVVVTIGACVFVGGVALLVQRALLMHQFSLWAPLRVADLWYTLGGAPPDSVAWLGAADLFAWFLDLPLTLVLAIVGTVTVWLAFAGKRQH
jgi:ribose/xylose/arabinose/galactoside ABC-type transport system permease subunit